MAVCLLAGMLTSCWSAVELSDLMLVMGIAVDISTLNAGFYHITYQSVLPGEADGTSSQSGNDAFSLSYADVNAIASSYVTNERSSSRMQFLKDMQLIVISKAMAEKGIGEIIDYFMRNNQTRLNVYLVISETRADELLHISSGQDPISSMKIAKMLTLKEREGVVYPTRLYEYAIDMISETSSPIVPMIGITDDSADERLEITNTAVFHKNRLVGILDKTSTKIMGLLRSTKKSYTGGFAFELEGKSRYEFTATNAKTKLDVSIVDGHVYAYYDIKMNVEMQAMTTDYDVSDIFQKYEIVEEAKKAIGREVEVFFSRIKELNIDVLGLGEALRRKYPKESQPFIDDWFHTLGDITYSYDIELSTISAGSISNTLNPAGGDSE